MRCLRERLGRGQDAHVVGGLARRGDDLVGVGRHAHHAVHDRVHGRRGFEVVIGDDDLGAAAELTQPFLGDFGGFDFDIDGVRAVAHGEIEHRELLFDAAVELAVVLMAAAGGQDDAVGKLFQEAADGLGALGRAGPGSPGGIQGRFSPASASRRACSSSVGNVWQAQRDTDARERPRLRHGREDHRIPQEECGTSRNPGLIIYHGVERHIETAAAGCLRRRWLPLTEFHRGAFSQSFYIFHHMIEPRLGILEASSLLYEGFPKARHILSRVCAA